MPRLIPTRRDSLYRLSYRGTNFSISEKGYYRNFAVFVKFCVGQLLCQKRPGQRLEQNWTNSGIFRIIRCFSARYRICKSGIVLSGLMIYLTGRI
jgi:uncharacterized membrane protein YiaA